MKHLINTISTLIITFSFLLSASGFVFHYHLCKKNNIKHVSLFINANQEYCHCCDLSHNQNYKESSCCGLHNDEQQNKKSCCASDTSDSECCGNHNIISLSAKISDAYNVSESNTIPEPLTTTLICCLLNIHNKHTADIDYELKPYENPIAICNLDANYGRIISIRNHSLKLHC